MSSAQFLALLAALVLLFLLIALLRRFSAGEGPLPYFSREFLLSRGECVFYLALRRAVPAHLMICPKVRMIDVINCSNDARKQGYAGRISQKHVDFVLADVETTAIAMVIELDDRSHRRSDRQQRDQFVDRAYAAAGVPILHVPAAAAYDVRALRQQIAAMVKDTSGAQSAAG